ncbi:MAG: hypothetical protein QHH19_06195 [Candidatus Thermoplasmatota archaeon]|nr:hypothetical protein [Candidatus Thermoplasmatota archaeon]
MKPGFTLVIKPLILLVSERLYSEMMYNLLSKHQKTPFEPQYPSWFLDKHKERVAVERFFSRLKEIP